MNKILIIEDDAAYGLTISNWAKKNGYEPTHCMTMELAKKEILRQNFRIALTDLRLPDGDGIMLLAWIKDKRPDVQVIVMTSYAEIQSAVSAIKLGAFDYLEKPVNPRILKEKIEQAMQNAPLPSPRVSVSQKKQRDGDEDRDGNRVGNIVYGESPASKQLYDYIRIVAPTNMSVLIVGESGTGKEHAAHMIHEYSPRSAAPFIAVDCGSLSRELAPSELFGHLKGAFTSAVANKKGVFEVANGGTVFLDEVGNLPTTYRYSCCAPCRSVRYARSAQPTISLSTYASSLPPTKISKRPLRPDGFGKTCTTDLMNSCCECLPCGNGTATCRDTWNISWKTPTRN